MSLRIAFLGLLLTETTAPRKCVAADRYSSRILPRSATLFYTQSEA